MNLLTMVALATASALLLAACGTGQGTASPPDAGSAGETTAGRVEGPSAVAATILPEVKVLDVGTGKEVALRSVQTVDRPLLIWAWAPHCPVCAGEAPGVQAFAEEHEDDLSVVGLGTQDDFGMAQSFVETYGVSRPTMLWDPGFDSWQSLGITAQPTWILLSPQGEEIGRWLGQLPEDEILSAAT